DETRGRATSTPRLTSVRALVRVDLRALKAAGEVHVDRLPLGEHLEAGNPGFPVPVSGVLDAAERKVDLGADRRRVHVEDPGLEIPHRSERAVDVARIDGSGEAVLDGVRHANALFERPDGNHSRDRSEDLLAGNAHVRGGAAEDGRRKEEPARQVPVGELLAPAEEVGALALPDLDVFRNGLALPLRDARPDLHAGLEPVADLQG